MIHDYVIHHCSLTCMQYVCCATFDHPATVPGVGANSFSGAHVGVIGVVVPPPVARFECLLGLVGCPLVSLGGLLVPSWLVRATWGRGASRASLGPLMAVFWFCCWPRSASLRPPWGLLGHFVGASWGPFGVFP
eukprot:6712490-Pyramimonas_sp.AAC.1